MILKSEWARNVLVLVLASSFGSIVWAAQENQTKTKSGKAVTVTGCLQKGEETGEYSITSEDGKRYGLRSKAVDLSKHLGHKVTVTGTKMREENEEKEKKEAGGVNTRTPESRISSISVKPASKQFRGAGLIKAVRLLIYGRRP